MAVALEAAVAEVAMAAEMLESAIAEVAVMVVSAVVGCSCAQIGHRATSWPLLCQSIVAFAEDARYQQQLRLSCLCLEKHDSSFFSRHETPGQA
jgi:hypothetical protein